MMNKHPILPIISAATFLIFLFAAVPAFAADETTTPELFKITLGDGSSISGRLSFVINMNTEYGPVQTLSPAVQSARFNEAPGWGFVELEDAELRVKFKADESKLEIALETGTMEVDLQKVSTIQRQADVAVAEETSEPVEPIVIERPIVYVGEPTEYIDYPIVHKRVVYSYVPSYWGWYDYRLVYVPLNFGIYLGFDGSFCRIDSFFVTRRTAFFISHPNKRHARFSDNRYASRKSEGGRFDKGGTHSERNGDFAWSHQTSPRIERSNTIGIRNERQPIATTRTLGIGTTRSTGRTIGRQLSTSGYRSSSRSLGSGLRRDSSRSFRSSRNSSSLRRSTRSSNRSSGRTSSFRSSGRSSRPSHRSSGIGRSSLRSGESGGRRSR